MSIRIEWTDLGTQFRRESPSRNPPHQFMDLGWWVQNRNYEHYFYEADEMIHETIPQDWNVDRTPIAPWPEPFSNHMWIDRTDRYETIEGWFLECYGHDQVTDTYFELPRAPHLWLDVTYEPPEINPQETTARNHKHHNPTEAALYNPMDVDPDTLSRLPFKNETEAQDTRFRGYTHLKEPILTDLQGHDGSSIALVSPNDSIIIAPFDFRKPHWYKCFDKDGVLLPGDTEDWLHLRPDQDYVIHLRPRWWRCTVFLLAHYAYVSLWGIQLNDEYFTHVFFDRPCVYPYRHDAIHSKQTQGYPNWNNDMRSYDLGIDMWWETTKAAGNLRREVLDQQYSWYCVVYIFLNNENPDLFFEAWPPRKNEIVAVIEHVDKATGSRSPVYVRQARYLDDEFPKFQWGAFIANWLIVPEPARWKPGRG